MSKVLGPLANLVLMMKVPFEIRGAFWSGQGCGAVAQLVAETSVQIASFVVRKLVRTWVFDGGFIKLWKVESFLDCRIISKSIEATFHQHSNSISSFFKILVYRSLG